MRMNGKAMGRQKILEKNNKMKIHGAPEHRAPNIL